MSYKKIKLLEYLDQCNKHVTRMLHAYEKISIFMPLNNKSYEQLTSDNIETIDQFLFRFSCLQDTMGENLFKAFLNLTGEETKNKTFLDILNRLEELDILEKTTWLELRELRNKAVHEYSQVTAEIIINLNLLYSKTHVINNIFKNLEKLSLKAINH